MGSIMLKCGSTQPLPACHTRDRRILKLSQKRTRPTLKCKGGTRKHQALSGMFR